MKARFGDLARALAMTIVLGPAAWCVAEDPSGGNRPPNILFIMSDDHAAHAIGAYGGRLAALDPTPHIDRLAREGVRLTNCFVTNSICTPSRATIITGQYSHRHGCYGFANGIEPRRQALAHLMKQAGYETALIGKWHLIHEPAAFDFYCVLPGQGSYFNPVFRAHADSSRTLPRRLTWGLATPAPPWPHHTFRMAGYDCVHADDAITDISLAWLKNRRAKDKPFFLMHHFKGPHDNFENAERYDFLYEKADIPEPASLRERGNHGPAGKPQYGTSVSKRNTRRNMGHHMFVDPGLADEQYTGVSYQRYLKKYLRTVRGVDDNVGRLFDDLEQSGQLDNTIVIYTADQGFMLGEHDYIDKRWMYEESLRMPFLIRYPARFKAGSTVDDLIANVDFAPTVLELAGCNPGQPFQADASRSGGVPEASGQAGKPDIAAGQAGMPDVHFQGRSFVANLQGDTPDDWPAAVYYRYWLHMAHHDNPAHYGIRTRTHKLIFFYGLPLDVTGAVQEPTEPHWELYDLVNDPQEMNNVYHDPAYAELADQLKTNLLNLKKQVGDDDERFPALIDVLGKSWD
jgi:N-acetylglucosamine-6-sulfatase